MNISVNTKINIKVKKLPNFPDNFQLKYGTEFSSGLDLIAAIKEDVTIDPLERLLIPTGILISMPEGFEGQIRSRSGLAINSGISVLNSPGTIDNDYRGEIKVILINHGYGQFTISTGMKIAQLVFCEFRQGNLEYVDDIQSTQRGQGGFGSTGTY